MTGLDLVSGLLLLGMVGVVFALVFVRTGNLFIVVGLHALYDAPTLLFANSGRPSMVMLLVVALALLVWPRVAMRGNAWRRVNPCDGDDEVLVTQPGHLYLQRSCTPRKCWSSPAQPADHVS